MRRGTAILALLLSVALISPTAAAGPALLLDAKSGTVLYAEDPDNPWHPASLAKLMTAYLTFEAIKSGRLALTTKIKCSAAANAEPPSKIGLPVGRELTVHLALQALIIKSANDVAVMLAEAVGGSEPLFVAKMNETAKRLGMESTNFVNTNGLPAAAQVTTARDLGKLARAILADFPEYAHYWSMQHMRLGKNRLRSHNGLLQSVEGADGLKTGFTCDSGFNIVATATRDGRQLIAVVLGDPTSAARNVRAASLLEYGFQQGGWAQIFNSKTVDNMPFAPRETTVKSVRASVASWGCNTKKPRVVNAGKKQKRTAKKNGARKIEPKAEKAESVEAQAPAAQPEPAQGEAAEASVATENGAEPTAVELRGAVGLANSAQ
jgi:D-alanyl-D-alanine carboxypeptidase